ncbi:hypothetical protein [Tsuneonella sp. HG222]
MARTTHALCALALAASLPFAAMAAQGSTPDGTTPADPRDFSGVWMNDYSLDEQLKREGKKRLDPGEPEGPPRAEMPLTPEYQAIRAERAQERARLAEGAQGCEWPGMPRIMTYPYPLEILHTPGRVTMIFEAESQVRRIFLDRAEHLPEDELDPTYNGDSIGRWEGDTLVVDTIGLHDRTEFGAAVPHSTDLRIVERMRYIDGDTMEVKMTLIDPRAFTQPIEQTVIYSKRPDWRIREYSCAENNRDAPDASGERRGGVVDSEE